MDECGRLWTVIDECGVWTSVVCGRVSTETSSTGHTTKHPPPTPGEGRRVRFLYTRVKPRWTRLNHPGLRRSGAPYLRSGPVANWARLSVDGPDATSNPPPWEVDTVHWVLETYSLGARSGRGRREVEVPEMERGRTPDLGPGVLCRHWGRLPLGPFLRRHPLGSSPPPVHTKDTDGRRCLRCRATELPVSVLECRCSDRLRRFRFLRPSPTSPGSSLPSLPRSRVSGTPCAGRRPRECRLWLLRGNVHRDPSDRSPCLDLPPEVLPGPSPCTSAA